MTNHDLARRLADAHPGLEFDAVLIGANVNEVDERIRGEIQLDARGRFLDGEHVTTSALVRVEEGGRIMVTRNTRYLVALEAETEQMRREASLEPVGDPGPAPLPADWVPDAEPAGGMYEGAVAFEPSDPKLVIDWEALRVTTGSSPFSIGSPVVNGLSKLIEEAGEVIQVGGKIIALGGLGDHYDGSNLGERLDEELADLLAAIDFVIVKNGRNKKAIEARRIGKRARFEEWNADARAAA